MHEELAHLKTLSDQLKACADAQSRLAILDNDSKVRAFLNEPSWIRTAIAGLSVDYEVAIKSLIAIGQQSLFSAEEQEVSHRMHALLESLIPIEEFYIDMGGIVGYHCTMLTLMRTEAGTEQKKYIYEQPPLCDISSDSLDVQEYILAGIRSLPYIAELYPVGGAADRLHLIDPETKNALPAAKLLFCGKTLLAGLIADIQAREYLYYKLTAKQITIPVAMMTSQEKDNHRQILSICQLNNWFGRSQESFHFFCQPAVPLMDKEGNWCMSSDGKLKMKPGGHGVIWKMARDSGVLAIWKSLGIQKILIRQINNPIAGCDKGLLAFSGIGFLGKKVFGFASCPRQIESAEGINVLLKRKVGTAHEYCLTNVEYCDFKKWGIEDKPVEKGSCYSSFPSNTNILFADISVIEKAIEHCPIPGMIVNLKKMNPSEDRETARLESTMQNIADCLIERFDDEAELPKEALFPTLQTFLTYNLRRKTISTTKRSLSAGQSLLETPEGCFFDMLHNAHDLLTQYCGFELPALDSCEKYLSEGPPFLFMYHPALGPLYSLIGQKIKRGKLSLHSELHLEIAELDCEELDVQGSLRVTAEAVMGSRTQQGKIEYNTLGGKCILKRVTVKNQGLDMQARSCYWKNEIIRRQQCEILLHGNGEFIAEDVILEGDLRIEVEDGFRVRAFLENGTLQFTNEKIHQPSWEWKYTIRNSFICAEKVLYD